MMRVQLKNRVLILIVFLLIGTTIKLAAQEGITPFDVAKIETVSSVYLSEDGSTAAYLLSVPADPLKENALPTSQLHVVDVADGEVIASVTDISVSGVAFRPGYNSITYIAQRDQDGLRKIYELPLDGGESRKLFEFDTHILGYEWASDGNHIVFRATEVPDSGPVSLPYQPTVYEENLTNARAWIQNVAMSGHMPHIIPVEGHVVNATWSPDREKLALSVAPSPLVDDFYMFQKVLIVSHEGNREVLAEVDHEGGLGEVRWSPDSDKLSLIAAASINDPIAGRLKIADAETGNTTLLRNEMKGDFDHVEWKDNNTLYYLASKGVWSEFGTIRDDGSNMRAMVETGGPNLTSFTHGGDVVVFTADSPAHPSEMYMMKAGDDEPVRVTDSNPWLDEKSLATQEVIRYTTEDGTEIEGILVYPLGFERGERYPLINVIHGGPEAHYDNGWLTGYSTVGQMGAAQGYAVFYPNYRGSTGRGLEFAMSSQGDLAGAEFDDIVEGVDFLIDEGLADGDKVGVTGGSYGGYATAWMSTKYSDRFAAGVMFVGISNNISKWGTSDIPEELYNVHARKRVWDDYMDFLERSPIYHVDKAKTPLLIMHGEEDTRVDPGQSFELYRHIKTRTNTPVRLVLYPGEGHGNRRSTARLDYSLRSMRWFNQYLKGENNQTRPDTEIRLQEAEIKN